MHVDVDVGIARAFSLSLMFLPSGPSVCLGIVNVPALVLLFRYQYQH